MFQVIGIIKVCVWFDRIVFENLVASQICNMEQQLDLPG